MGGTVQKSIMAGMVNFYQCSILNTFLHTPGLVEGGSLMILPPKKQHFVWNIGQTGFKIFCHCFDEGFTHHTAEFAVSTGSQRFPHSCLSQPLESPVAVVRR